MKPFQFKIQKRVARVDFPSFERLGSDRSEEQLIGTVQGKEASAPEERLAKALDKAEIQYIFRYVVGAPKGLPGWKEVDFVVFSGGAVRLVEVDTAFTHRNKEQADKLHDAIALNDYSIRSMGDVWPEVEHVSGDSDLSTQEGATTYVKRNFTKGASTVGRATEFQTPPPPRLIQESSPAAVAQEVAPIPQMDKKEPKPSRIVKAAKKQVVTTNRAMDKKISRYEKGR